MKTYYVLSGNQVLGHFHTLRESWTLEEALELAGLNEEWLNATGESFETVVCAAAEKMGGIVL